MAESASPIGIANLPNQRHKIVAKRGAAFTIMVAGESGLGKTTFINTLFSTTIKNYADHKRRHQKQVDKTVEIEITKAELEEKFFKVRLTVIDTPGFGDYVNNRDSWQPIIEFLDDQHESYMLQEQQPKRTEKIDLRVHACLYFIRPTGHTLKPLDIEVMKRLCTRVNLIPVVAKADTLSPADLAKFKAKIRSVVEAQGIKIYQPPLEEDDEAGLQHARSLIAAMPFSVIGSEKDVSTHDGRTVKGRQYAWGVAEVENEEHCDFKKLRAILIRTHMLDLIHTTEENHYEAYRAQQMETRKFGEARPRKLDNPKFKEEEEALRKRFTEQVKVEEQRFRQWEQKLISERDRLNKDLEQSHAVIKQLEAEVEALQGSVTRSHGRRPVHAVTYSAGLGQYSSPQILTGCSDRTIRLFNPARGGNSLVQTYEAHGYEVLDLAVAADNARFASVGGDKQVFLWDVASATTLRSFDATVKLWDLKSQSNKPLMTLSEAKDSISSVCVWGHEIFAGCVDGRVRMYDLRMGQVFVDVVGPSVTSITPTRDADSILTSTLDSTIRLMDKSNGKLLQSYKAPEYVNTTYRIRSTLGLKDAVAIAGSEDGSILAWDVVQGTVLHHLRHGEPKGASKKDVVSAVAFCPKRNEFASAGGDGNVVVWGL
ncbi:putative cell division control protein 12 protein [Neofusicoccum parvum]|nr:putative cell division control protein 12 protein [Neofusicoccum parvum UCRNP2]GME54955.1 putative cell division control protein 12 protein [Neofusicoccum parvum]